MLLMSRTVKIHNVLVNCERAMLFFLSWSKEMKISKVKSKPEKNRIEGHGGDDYRRSFGMIYSAIDSF